MKADWFSEIKDQEYFETLSHPHCLELDGLVILKAHYTPESFRRWKDRLGLESPAAELSKVENAINHVHLDDLIDKESLQGNIGEYLRQAWLDALHAQFPEYEFECSLTQTEMGWELGLWKRR